MPHIEKKDSERGKTVLLAELANERGGEPTPTTTKNCLICFSMNTYTVLAVPCVCCPPTYGTR
jgi:hypothetical protein